MRLARRARAARQEQAPDAPAAAEDQSPAPRRRTLRATRLPGAEEEPGTAAGHARTEEEPGTAAGHARTEEEPGTAAGQPVTAANEPLTGEHPPEAASPEGDGSHRPEKRRSGTGRIRALIDEQVGQSREEAERQAAMELRQFMEPARQQLVLNVPGSSSPEEAQAILASQAASVLDAPVDIRPEEVVDLRNPSSMGAYPESEKLSNRVLRLADRHWSKGKRRSSADIVAEKAAIAEREFARKPAGTQRCLAQRGSNRCRGVFAYHADDQSGGSLLACPTCGAQHTWDPGAEAWALGPDVALSGPPRRRSALTSGS